MHDSQKGVCSRPLLVTTVNIIVQVCTILYFTVIKLRQIGFGSESLYSPMNWVQSADIHNATDTLTGSPCAVPIYSLWFSAWFYDQSYSCSTECECIMSYLCTQPTIYYICVLVMMIHTCRKFYSVPKCPVHMFCKLKPFSVVLSLTYHTSACVVTLTNNSIIIIQVLLAASGTPY